MSITARQLLYYFIRKMTTVRFFKIYDSTLLLRHTVKAIKEE
jgi:hypothetical protein